MSSELRPCPFCGGDVSFHKDEDCQGCHLIQCVQCHAFFDFATGADPGNDCESVDALRTSIAPMWNTRAHPTQQGEAVKVVAWLDEGPDQPDCTASQRVMMDWANCGYTIQPLMTVAQHERIVAALSAQQSASPEFCCELSYKTAKQKAWDARRIHRCKCDHNEYCGHCWPVDFRPGGKWHGGFVALQPAHDVSVPRDIALALLDGGPRAETWAAQAKLRALLNGGEA